MINRGEVYFVSLSPTQGREQAGRRPVLVVSADAINRQPLVVTVVVGTDAKKVPRDYPTNVRVTAKEIGLPEVARLDHRYVEGYRREPEDQRWGVLGTKLLTRRLEADPR